MRKITENESNALVGGKKNYWVWCDKHQSMLYYGTSHVKAYAAWWAHAITSGRCASRYVKHNL